MELSSWDFADLGVLINYFGDTILTEKQVFMSHSSFDQDICNGLGELIEKCSLRQIRVWHSSDGRAGSGMHPSDRWFPALSDRLRNSQAVVVLCTEAGINSDWVKFEAGFGAASSKLEIIPLLIGIEDITKVPAPFSQWQMYKIDTEQRCLDFLKKLLPLFDVHFEEVVVKTCFEEFRPLLERTSMVHAEPTASKESGLNRDYFEKKFMSIEAAVRDAPSAFSGYLIEIENRISAETLEFFVEYETTFGEFMDTMWGFLYTEVEPYTYLLDWLMKDVSTNQVLAISDIQNEIPARFVLTPGRKIAALRISKPYVRNRQ
ncbi:MAG: toll/interleukin-1 receptor domain-containing protein [Sulfitobacter sp.]